MLGNRTLGKRMRHLGRYREIATALIRHGFGMIVQEIGITQLLSWPQRVSLETRETSAETPKDGKTLGERIRLLLQELGPTFVKLGQIASTRRDVIPEAIICELEKLQDQVPPFSFPEVRAIVEAELGSRLEAIFRDFEATPLAAASIGQVHRAQLWSGEKVAVKVQRPDIASVIETDLAILQDLAMLAEHRLSWAARYRVGDIVAELARSLQEELDFTVEGRHAERIAAQFKDDRQILVPSVFWDYSTKKVLTMAYVEGIKLSELEKLKQQGYNLQRLASRLVHATLQQIFDHGLFHADPHPGNVFVLPGEVIALIDFGMVGRLTPEMKYHLASLVIAMMQKSTDGVIKAIHRMGLVSDEVDPVLLREDVEQLREKYYGMPLSQIHLGEAVNDLFRVAYRHAIRIPSDLTLLGKTLLTLEGVVETLAPEVSILDIAEPFGRYLFKQRLRPQNVAERLWRRLSNYSELLLDFPKQVKAFTALLRQGKLRLEIGLSELDIFLKKLDQIANRVAFSIGLLAFSIIMVGVIIGSTFGRQPTLLWKVPAVEIGFVMATLMFLWLLYSIFKSGRL